MNKLLLSVAVLPFIAGAASAGQPLNDTQMDRVTAGFDSTAIADAQALGLVNFTQAATLAEDSWYRTGSNATPVLVTIGETTLHVWKQVTAAQAISSASTALPIANLPGVGP